MAGGRTLTWLFFGFSGRISRQPFILGILLLLVLEGIIVIQMVKAGENQQLLGLWGMVFILVAALVVWPILALTIKRLHDRGHPGALSLILFFPGINWLMVLYLMAAPSERQANPYGPPPISGAA